MTQESISARNMRDKYPVPDREEQRLSALAKFKVMDTPPEAEFDHIARLAADLFQVPTALVSFVGRDRQFFKARVGFAACETSRDASFCAHALVRDDVLVVPDARNDDRFRDNPLVTGAPFIRFYAGAPLRTASGLNIGSVCIIDSQPRPPLTEHETDLLRSLARITMDHVERRQLDVLKRASIQMAGATSDAIVCSDEEGAITFWNAAAERIFGFSRKEAVGRPREMIISDEHRARYLAEMGKVKAGHSSALAGKTTESIGLRKDGGRFPVELSIAVWRDGEAIQVGSIIRDISARKQAQERVRILTHSDRLTGLPNRVSFLERIDEALRETGCFTVLKIGFDKFKTINGSMGMAAGDEILKAGADRVRAAAAEADFVARLGADEFGLLRIDSDDPSEAEAIAGRLLSDLCEPYVVQGSICHLGVSIGTILCPEAATFQDADAVLKGALLALQRAKDGGGRRSEVFRPQLGREAAERHVIEEELREAFTSGEFELHYQPQVRLSDHALTGAEALLRWRHPERGLLSPAMFLPILEAGAIATEVGQWIVETACGFAAELASGDAPIRMGVNLFGAQLRTPTFYEDVAVALSKAGLRSELLELEITETTVLGLEDDVVSPLIRLRDLGVKIAFDDYGTGFASLSLLKRYPLTRLKIDRQFVSELETNPDDAAIVKAVLALGRSLGLEVIAEGIETVEQASILKAFGCQEAQGYLFGKPMPKSEFKALLARRADAEAA